MAADLTVMTFNVRYDELEDGAHAWRHRRSIALRLIRDHDPDLLGVQEASTEQWQDMAAALHGYAAIGFDGETGAPGAFIRQSRFDRSNTGLFWLSDTPSVPDSITWPNDYGPRRCCWARLHDRDADRPLLFACTHVDTNAAAWLPSARILDDQLSTFGGDAGRHATVLVGDFNCAAASAAHAYLRDRGFRDAWNEAGHADAGVITYNGFAARTSLPSGAEAARWLDETSQPRELFGHYPNHVRAHGNYRIDWILLRGHLACVSAENDYRTEAGVLPSDHYPVVARLTWRSPADSIESAVV